MNNIFKIFFLFTLGLAIVSCSKSDSSTEPEPLRDYVAQRDTDMTNIEAYMQTHHMEVVDHPGQTDDQDVTFTLIPAGPTSIWNQYPIKTRYVKVRQNDVDITYKIYFIELRQGTGANSKSPCNVDRVLTSYRGEYVYSSTEQVNGVDVTSIKSKEFEESINPQSYFNLTSVIRGWSEIFPQFKTGSYSGNPDGVYPPNLDGTTSYYDFGAGVMFIPSGLAYFATATGGIPAYSPLIFSFKLYEIQRVDHDGDGIFSYQEDLATSTVNSEGTVTFIPGVPDGYVNILPTGVFNTDNTNGPETAVLIGANKYSKENEVPDFLDIDDDGDYFTTKSEIKNPITGIAYPFADIPTCGGTGNGKKKHLDPSCHGQP
jgi:hypothetical protein